MEEEDKNKVEVRHEPKLIEAHEPALSHEEEARPVVSEAPKAEPVVEKHGNTPGVIVLQWLSYAFWGWLILALIWLVGIIATNAITGNAIENVVPYAMAATIVLLPIAFVTDFFYRRHEPLRKTGAATVIMVIHVVLYALLGIGTLIALVFTLLSMVIGSNDTQDSQLVALWVLGAATLLYASTFLRVLNPFKSKRFAMIFGFSMLAVTLGLLIWGVLGPVLTSLSLKDDRRIEQNLGDVSRSVNDYIASSKKLPNSLNNVTISSEEGKQLVTDGLVRYKKVGASTPTNYYAPSKNSRLEYRYELCVDYKHKDASSSRSYYDYGVNGQDDYKSYVSTYGHPAGEVCYKLQETVYTNSSNSPSALEELNSSSRWNAVVD